MRKHKDTGRSSDVRQRTSFLDGVQTQAHVDLTQAEYLREQRGKGVLSPFRFRFGISLEQLIRELAPLVVRLMPPDSAEDSREIWIAWGRVVEARWGMSRVAEDEIRSMSTARRNRMRNQILLAVRREIDNGA